jgi:hypothetical protein
VNKPSIIGSYFAQYKNGKLSSRGVVVDDYAGQLRMHRINSKGKAAGIFDIPMAEVGDDFVFHDTAASLDLAVLESSYATVWRLLVPPGLAALNEHDPVSGCSLFRRVSPEKLSGDNMHRQANHG